MGNDRPTKEYPATAARFSTTIGAKRTIGVLVVSPIPGFLYALRKPFSVAEDLMLGAGLTFEAAIGALLGISPKIILVDDLVVRAELETTRHWLETLSYVPFVLFGDTTIEDGYALATEVGMNGYFKRPESAINFVAKCRQCILQYWRI